MKKLIIRQVEVPKNKGVHIKKAGANKDPYVYIYTSHYRNEDGKSRHKATLIGRYVSEKNMMIPNDNYIDLFGLEAYYPSFKHYEFGYTYIFNKIVEEIKLLEHIKQVFGKRTDAILKIAAYMIKEDNVMYKLEDWQQKNYFKNSKILTSQAINKLFESITEKEMNNFFVNWIKANSNDSNICYDVTSISSYSEKMNRIERGYNRDHEDLGQINLGMFCREIDMLPLYYNIYSGSLTDKVNLEYVLNNASDVGINDIKLVCDGGFWSKNCFIALKELTKAFTIGMPIKLIESNKVFNELGSNIVEYEYKLSNCDHIYSRFKELAINGAYGKAHLYFDSLSQQNQWSDLNAQITKLESELLRLKYYPKDNLKHYTKFFDINKNESDPGFNFKLNLKKVKDLRTQKGYYLIFTTDKNVSAERILDYYREKDSCEKLFQQIKDYLEAGRLKTYSHNTTNGKIFVTFIACIIRSYLSNKIKPFLHETSTSVDKVLNQLSAITISSSNTNNCFRLTNALTKVQKNILSIFGSDQNILDDVKKM